MTTATDTPIAPADVLADVLAAARAHRAAAVAAEAQVLLAACTWADLHPPETLADAAWADDHCDGEVLLAGEGAPGRGGVRRGRARGRAGHVDRRRLRLGRRGAGDAAPPPPRVEARDGGQARAVARAAHRAGDPRPVARGGGLRRPAGRGVRPPHRAVPDRPAGRDGDGAVPARARRAATPRRRQRAPLRHRPRARSPTTAHPSSTPSSTSPTRKTSTPRSPTSRVTSPTWAARSRSTCAARSPPVSSPVDSSHSTCPTRQPHRLVVVPPAGS